MPFHLLRYSNKNNYGLANIFGRKSLAGSLAGGVAQTQEVIDYCAARNLGIMFDMPVLL